MTELKISVITPTFNRVQELPRVYRSLCSQTFRGFEWIIVDDGSTDNTKELINSFKEECNFKINYVYQNNGHKKLAVNTGLDHALGQFTVIADSDDAFPENAFAEFIDAWDSIPESNKLYFSGVYGICVYENGSLVGDKYPCKDYLDSDTTEIRRKYKVSGEKWGMVRTEVMKNHKFPQYISGHVPEDVMWSVIAENYKTRFFNKIVRVYYQNSSNQLSKIIDFRPHVVGALLSKKISLQHEIKYFTNDPIYFLIEACRWWRFLFHSIGKIRLNDYIPKNPLSILLILLAFPIGLSWYFFDSINIWLKVR